MFRLFAPREVGGLEVPLPVASTIFERLAGVDPAVTWYMGTSAAVGFAVDLRLGSGIGFLAGGALVSVMGLVLLAGFLRAHPRPETGTDDGALPDAR